LATEVSRLEAAWSELEMCRRAVADAFAAIVGFTTVVEAVTMDEDLGGSIAAAGEGASELFILPVSLEFDLLQREALGRGISEARRRHPEIPIHCDNIDPGDSLIVDSLAAQTMKTVEEAGADPRRAGLIFAAMGQGDASSRAQSYRVMRLLWEQLGFAAGEIGFLRHDRPFLLSTLEKCERAGMDWIVVPRTLWKSHYFEYMEVILQNFQRSHPAAARWPLANPPGSNPGVTAWLTRRISRLWNEKRTREETRGVSRKSLPRLDQKAPTRIGSGMIASVSDHAQMS